jgi:DNA repair protein RadD
MSFGIIFRMSDMWIGTDEAAEYLGMGKTKLYALTREGRIPANRVGKKWMYDRQELAAWMQSSQRFEDFFLDTPVSIDGNPELREPQRDAYFQAAEFFQGGGKKALMQLPVGCGKSGVAAILPFGIAAGRVLVIAPNLTIKQELYDAFDITNRQKCFWRKRGVLEDRHMKAGPYVCTLDTGNLSVCEKSHVVVTNIQQFGTNADKWLNKFPEDFFDLIIVDEAHHGAATSWQRVFSHFPNAKVANLTATPFRSDRQELEGELIFRYPFKSASIKGYIKKLKASYAAPCELTFTLKGEERTYMLDEVLAMKDEEWFSRGVALSQPCNVSIVDNSLEKLEFLRQTGTKHQLIAVACSIPHARQDPIPLPGTRLRDGDRAQQPEQGSGRKGERTGHQRSQERGSRLHRSGSDAWRGLRPSKAERCGNLSTVPLPCALHPVHRAHPPGCCTERPRASRQLRAHRDPRWDEPRRAPQEVQAV